MARPSHLARHLQSHLPPSQRDHFSCGECGRQFSRNDVLLRHLRTAHQASISRKRSAQKSCFRCVKKKLKCDRTQTCTHCIKTGSLCKYPGDETDLNDEVLEGKAESPVQTTPQFPEDQPCQNDSFQSPETYQRHPETQLSLVHGAPGYMQNTSQRPAGVQTFTNDPRFFQPASEPTALDMMPADLMSVSFSNASPTNAAADFNPSMIGFERYLPGDFNFTTSNPAPRIVGMAEGGVDWLNLDLDSPNNGEYQAQYQAAGAHPGLSQSMMSAGLEDVLQTRGHQAMSTRFESMRTQEPKNGSSKPSEAQAAAHQWPFDQTRNAQPQKYRLPPLRDILQGTIASTGPDNETTMRSLIQLLSLPYLPDMDHTQDVSMMSAMDILKNSLDLYFSEFHSVLPLVHVPTWSMTKVPTVTLAAMASIGAMYSDDRQGTEQSFNFSEMCIQMIAWLVRNMSPFQCLRSS